MPSLDDVARSTLYFVASLPLGVAYVALVAAGVAAGVSLLVFVVGVVVLAATAAAARRVAAVDAAASARLFGFSAPTLAEPRRSDGVFDATAAELTSPSGYRAAAYLLVRSGVGIAGFVFVATWLGLTLGLLGAPLYYDDPNFTVGAVGIWEVSTLAGALAVSVVGAVVGVLGAVVVAPAGRVVARASAYVLALPRPDAP